MLLSRVGRRSTGTRVFIFGIYLVLILGAVTMVVPFLLMIAGSTKGVVDEREFQVLPSFLASDTVLYRKFVASLFNEQTDRMRIAYDLDQATFENLQPPRTNDMAALARWRAFVERGGIEPTHYAAGHIYAPRSGVFPLNFRRRKAELEAAYDGDLDAFNQMAGTEFPTWGALSIQPEFLLSRRNEVARDAWAESNRMFKASLPEGDRLYFHVEGFWRRYFLAGQYTSDIETYNEAHGTSHGDYGEVPLPTRAPAGPPAARADWENFVREVLHLQWLRADPAAQPRFARFLEARYEDVAILNRLYGSAYAGFDEAPLPTGLPRHELRLTDWNAFVRGWRDDSGTEHRIDLAHLRIESLETRFRAFTGVDEAPPFQALHAADFLARRNDLRREFLTRNYITVWDTIVRHGRGLWNTVVYCLLSVLVALIVNPMAAYALSRYRLRNTYLLLLFMLLTMAFPPMVTQIPVFLMLRDLHLLNTFAALILPGMAHGYSIFLLKGFFDSLPRELYESAEMDGAGEWHMFWTITMSLSKPILAVIALSAFTAAYSDFMFALLFCQDERMWTLMVWLYQLQQRSGEGVMYASLLLAAIPTFVIFVFCQNIILRGIVVPVEK